MKNCDEMVNSLFERRDRYVAEQKRKRKIIISTVSVMCCACLVTISGVASTQKIKSTVPSNPEANLKEGKAESYNISPTKIFINSIKDVETSKLNIDLSPNDYVEMTSEEMTEYYGVNYFPDVPTDMKLCEDKKNGIYRKDSGTGDVYWDVNILNYSNEDYSRTIHIELGKNSHLVRDYEFSNSTEEKSIISNEDVMIGLTQNGLYYAEFMHNQVEFYLNAEGVTEEEFVSIISSIIK